MAFAMKSFITGDLSGLLFQATIAAIAVKVKIIVHAIPKT